jgi:hypothetical protein
MNWKLKAHILALLSRIPGGSRAYHAGQRWLGTDGNSGDEYLSRAVEIVQMIRDGGADISGKTVVEVGTGWRPFVPFVLSLMGAERVVTFDVNPWLTYAYAIDTCQALSSRLGVIADRFGVSDELLQRRFDSATSSARGLNDLLREFRVEYRYPGDARRTGLADASVDVVCSSNVLAHVPPGVLRDIHTESFRILKDDCLTVHRFAPQDQFSAGDRSITGANFLQFSEKQWRWLGGSGLAYQNRLRCAQHRQMFQDAGFEIASERRRTDQRALTALRRNELKVDAAFAEFGPEELAADYLWIVGKRPPRNEMKQRSSQRGAGAREAVAIS